MKIPASAKINLTLEVLGTRSDGYHDLRSVVMPVSLHDDVEIEPADSLSCSTRSDGVDLSHLEGSVNLAAKAAAVLAAETGRRPDVAISILKRIPLGGGLGGGSADAAAALRALNELWGLGLSRLELATIGAWVGSDVPALALGGAVLMEGRGERVSPLEGASAMRPVELVLASPGVFSSTPAVFKASISALTERRGIVDNMRSALLSGDAGRIAGALVNDLAPAACSLYPGIARVIAAMERAGALGVSMTGSGSTVFAIARDRAHAEEIAAKTKAAGFDARIARTCPVM